MLEDKVVVVSGVGPGLGRSIALRGAHAGANVVLAARNEARLHEVAKEVDALGRKALVVPTDITDDTSAAALREAALTGFGRVDALVNNAFAMPPMVDLLEIDLEALKTALDTTTLAALRLTRLFAPALEDSGGAVVMINSMVVRHSRRTFGAYKMAKASLLAISQSLATELGPRGVRVNSVAPGYIWADNLRWYFAYLAKEKGVTAEEIYAETAATIDLRRLPEPDEVADAVLFLASPLARAITGQCLDVNGGEYHH
ncbi:NAD(P)-dependent dehydrogenase, short-chain alcohol dehydrogenase family [Amycolatopsis xylanica]|uniref:NAD(P)-dependent dehydrogenase, short-chain alcohol dehydrogenase family n=1 Tax=Amycolatopsis xylanica TaxID=589385 RepID=A0A1H2SW28_9PSEU|nr:SDR family oxidoreductase [Amycolatopsis xylanica]SDW35800.1 NAD(P)-dependent dehydrogenase, short-chain alcohol dehydrogenase family [Amycolatopsis xylanica]